MYFEEGQIVVQKIFREEVIRCSLWIVENKQGWIGDVRLRVFVGGFIVGLVELFEGVLIVIY